MFGTYLHFSILLLIAQNEMHFLIKKNYLCFPDLFSLACFQEKNIQQNIQIPNIHNCSYTCFLFLENATKPEIYGRVMLGLKVIGCVGVKAHAGQS